MALRAALSGDDGERPQRSGRALARQLAAELGTSKSAPWAWLNGRHPAPPELALAIERLTGDADLAREILSLIPSRNGSHA
jgi:DNA-binding transcriptional regulator YdaS (Cro superfamily)